MNRQLLKNPSRVYSQQAKNMLESISQSIADAKTESDRLGALFAACKDMFTNLGMPTMKKRYVYSLSPPSSETINSTMQEVKNDLSTAFMELHLIGSGATDNFDYSVAERMRIRNRVKKLGEMVNDYTVTAANTKRRNIIIQDSFTSLDKIDLDRISGTKAKVHTDQGFVTLAVKSAVNNCKDGDTIVARVLRKSDSNIEGNGWPSNFGVVKRISPQAGDKTLKLAVGGDEKEDEWEFLWGTDPHDDPQAIFDEQPNTWFEYQIINFSHKDKRDICLGYGLKFDNGEDIYYGDKNIEELHMALTIELPSVTTINWIALNPYFQTDVNKDHAEEYGLIVEDIKVSASGTSVDSFTSILEEHDRNMPLFSDIDRVPDEIKTRKKYTGHGVWSFSPKKAKFIRIELRNRRPYDTKIGHIYHERTWKEITEKRAFFNLIHVGTEVKHKSMRVEGRQISKRHVAYRSTMSDMMDSWGQALGTVGRVLGGVVGAVVSLIYNETTRIENDNITERVEAFDGWRWCIGIRDVEIMTNTYEEASAISSINYSVPKEIDEVSLSVTEYIPEEFYKDNITAKNSFIKYFLSFDGGNSWTRISPIEHTQALDEEFPPKIIVLNSNLPAEARDPKKAYVNTQGAANTTMFRADFSRPAGDDVTITPVLKDYMIRIVPKEVAE